MFDGLFDPVSKYLRYEGHIAPDVVLLNDASVMGMLELDGLPFELADHSERNAAFRLLNGALRNIADDNVTLCPYVVRSDRIEPQPAARFRSAFAARMDGAYRQRVLDGRLLDNRHYLAVLVAPRIQGSASMRAMLRDLRRNRTSLPAVDDDAMAQLRDTLSALCNSLKPYRPRIMAEYEHEESVCSPIAETLQFILSLDFIHCPEVDGPLNSLIYKDEAIFGTRRRAFHIDTPGAPRFGAMFGFREYPAKTRAGMLNKILSLPFPLVLAQSYSFLPRKKAVDRLGLKADQMKAGGDKAAGLIKDLPEKQSQVAGGEEVRGMHALSLAIYADSLEQLERNASLARDRMASASGAVVAREARGMKSAYFGQLPGNFEWHCRPGGISSRNFAALSSFEGYPKGKKAGWWGNAMVRFRTNAATSYDFVPHVDDVGMTAIFGPIGAGKTLALSMILAEFDQHMTDGGSIIYFGKDRGGEIFAQAMGGKTVLISPARPNVAPLRGLENTPEDVAYLIRWFERLIKMDGLGDLAPDDHKRLAQGVAAQMRLPVAMRSIIGLRQFLGWKDERGAGARLEKWCHGGSLGWMFDGDLDETNPDAGFVYYDPTEVLEDEMIFPPLASYLIYQTRKRADGRRMVVAIDEIRAYLKNEMFAELIEDGILTFRKLNVPVILAGQDPEHVLRSPVGRSLIGSCLTKIFFPAPTADRETYCGILHCTEAEFRAIRDEMLATPHRFLIKRDKRPDGAGDESGGEGSVIVDFDLSAMPEFIAVMSGRANTVRFAERLRAECGDAWLDEFMKRYKEATD